MPEVHKRNKKPSQTDQVQTLYHRAQTRLRKTRKLENQKARKAMEHGLLNDKRPTKQVVTRDGRENMKNIRRGGQEKEIRSQ